PGRGRSSALKPLRGESGDDWLNLEWTNSCALLSAREAAGADSARFPRALSAEGGSTRSQNPGGSRRGNASACVKSVRRRRTGENVNSSPFWVRQRSSPTAVNPLIGIGNETITLRSRWSQHNPRQEGWFRAITFSWGNHECRISRVLPETPARPRSGRRDRMAVF